MSATDVADFFDSGPDHFWWHDDATDSFLVTDTYEAPRPNALYLMPWSQSWFAQWAGDWEAAADQLNTVVNERTS
ncbi:hypothetical protein SEA_DOGGS_28 [Gordonia phage Doggs]|nr:hypothetical protein SEA_DOGGS_28 [Gordonia phage Doggs]